MDLPEYNKRLDKTITDIERQLYSKIMPTLATNAISLIKDRVVEKGVNAEGSKYKAYSTKAMLVGSKSFPTKSAGDKVFGSKDKRKNLEWRTLGEGEDARRLAILQGGYKQWREIMGRQTAHVDFSVSNDMWSSINLIKGESDIERGIAVIGVAGGDSELQNKKLSGNTARRGDILDLSKEEQKILADEFSLSVLNVFKQNGL